MSAADSAAKGVKPHGISPREYFTTRSNCEGSSTLLKKGNAAEKTNTRTAARRQISIKISRTRRIPDGSGSIWPLTALATTHNKRRNVGEESRHIPQVDQKREELRRDEPDVPAAIEENIR